MQATTWLRIAAGLTLFQAAGHTFGAVLAGPTHGPAEVTLRDSMRAFRVTAMGMERRLAGWYAAVTIISALYFVTAPIVVGAAITLSLVAATFSVSLEAGRRRE